jgi:hypothetical protein
VSLSGGTSKTPVPEWRLGVVPGCRSDPEESAQVRGAGRGIESRSEAQNRREPTPELESLLEMC